ncbi:MAG: hypothetical protein U0487_03650, partial [Patescibacteria group bacterium]
FRLQFAVFVAVYGLVFLFVGVRGYSCIYPVYFLNKAVKRAFSVRLRRPPLSLREKGDID